MKISLGNYLKREKGLDSSVLPEKQVMKPIVVTKMTEVSQIKPRLGQGRAGLRCKIKTAVSLLINKPIAQVMKNSRKTKSPSTQNF